MVSERLARETDAARVDCGGVAVRRRDRRVEQTRFAERPHELAARCVDVAMIDRGNRARSDKAIERAGKGAMGLAEERPVEPIALHLRRARRDVHQSPSKTGLRLAAKASKARRKSWVVMQIACACASDFDQFVEPHRPFLVQHRLGHAMREPGTVSERAGERERLAARGRRSDAAHCRSPRPSLPRRSSSGR